MQIKSLYFLFLLLCLPAMAAMARDAVRIEADFVQQFGEATVRNASQASASLSETAGGKTLPGIFLHPSPQGDAVARFEGLRMPALEAEESAFLLVRIGIRDGVAWGASHATPNGVHFSVQVNGETRLSEVLAESTWQARAIALDFAPGQPLDIAFHTNAIDGNPNYDWAIFGDPMLVVTGRLEEPGLLPEESNGVALAKVLVEEAGPVAVGVGEQITRAELARGVHWLPVHFGAPAAAALHEAQPGQRLERVYYARFPAQLEVRSYRLSSPLVFENQPVNVILELKNSGRGDLAESHTLRLQTPDGMREEVLPALPAGESAVVTWRDVLPGAATSWEFPDIQGLPEGTLLPALPYHVFPAPDSQAMHSLSLDSASSQLRFGQDMHQKAYAIAEVKQGETFETAGALYPLAELTLAAPPGTDAEDNTGRLRLERLEIEADVAVLQGTVLGQPVRLKFTNQPEHGRIHVLSELTATEDMEVRAFRGPTLLAGAGAFGAEKDFAIFPGLEYLEGEEHSSSERDLAFPLSERQVPARHKITTPLMAVQGRDMLIGMIWDMHQEWAPGEAFPAARFDAPVAADGHEHIHMSLFAPSVGDYVDENRFEARRPYPLAAGETLRLEYHLLLDSAARYPETSIVHGPHAGGLVLQAFRHYFDLHGLPEPSEPPRSLAEQVLLSQDAYFDAVWSEDPPGWRHCHGWSPGLFVGHATPLLLSKEVPGTAARHATVDRHANLVLDRALESRGPGYLWSGAGCHIMLGELPFHYGHVPEALAGLRDTGRAQLNAREDGLWVWRPGGQKYEGLGRSGDHTLGQAARPSWIALRAARLTGDSELTVDALWAMKQMERYAVPRGAQTWECPLYQPDILSAGQAVRAYMEAYRLTGDPSHLEHAKYWAWTGLPFLYMWEMDGYPTMRYNVIAVMGSTFYTHSWIGLPVVWCGLVYAYALQDLAPHDPDMDWLRIARGITNSAMWQQYTEGANRGTYPDSWDMVKNAPLPADINPENILVNLLRLEGVSPEPEFRHVTGLPFSAQLNSTAAIEHMEVFEETKTLTLRLHAPEIVPSHTTLAQVPRPHEVLGAGAEVADAAALQDLDAGWVYDEALQMLVLRPAPGQRSELRMAWEPPGAGELNGAMETTALAGAPETDE